MTNYTRNPVYCVYRSESYRVLNLRAASAFCGRTMGHLTEQQTDGKLSTPYLGRGWFFLWELAAINAYLPISTCTADYQKKVVTTLEAFCLRPHPSLGIPADAGIYPPAWVESGKAPTWDQTLQAEREGRGVTLPPTTDEIMAGLAAEEKECGREEKEDGT
jgi:hypothetical protein